MSWLRDSLEGKQAVEALPQTRPTPSWQLGEGGWRLLRALYRSAAAPEEITDVLQRLSTHMALLAGVIVVLALVRFGVLSPNRASVSALPASSLPGDMPIEAVASTTEAPYEEVFTDAVVYAFPPYTDAAQPALYRIQIPHTENAKATLAERPRTWIVTYEVQPGDSVWKIAQKFGLKPQTVEWANGLELNPDLLRVGQKLIIPPVDGVVHVVEAGDTLASIARRYKVKPEDIVAYEPNGLTSVNDALPEQKVLVIPNGIKPFVMPVVRAYTGPVPKGAKVGTGNFGWPTTGKLTSLFGQIVCSPRYGCQPHMGIDIANVPGTPIVAADSGYVAFAGWDRTGYGKLVIINHGNGFVTLYAHMSAIFVQKGQSVAKGQRIGSIGKTGNVTGYHLHFEMRQHGRQRNPLGFLPMP